MSGGTTETKTSSLSPWMEEAAKTQLGKATALTDINQNPYKQYEGQRIAEFNPMQQQYFQGVQNLQGSGAIGQGIGAAGEATQRALGTSYNPYATGQFGAQAGQYMDPYMQNVVDIQQREAQRQADIAGTQRGAQAVKAGAFGGSRQAIENAEAARNLATQKGDIQARGLQDAYSRAQQQFNTEQALGESSRQYGAGLGMQGLQTALSGASQLGGLGSTQFGQQKDILTAQQTAGAQQQAQEQAKLSQGYEDFLAQQKYPYQQLEFMSNIMRGTPYGTTTSMYSPGPSTASTLLGAGTSLAGAAMLGGWKPWMKEGGLATAYAAGGSVRSPENIRSIADSLLDADLSQAAAMAQARGDKQQDDVVQQEMASRAALRRGAQAMPEDQGIGQLPAGNMTYANGGIIAFADGGDVERYQIGGSTAAKTGPDFIKFLQRIGVDYFDFVKMPPAEKAAFATQFEQAKAASTAAPASAAPVAQAAQNTSKAFSAGKAAAPYLDKAGSVVKSSALPVLGGGLAAAQGLSEIDSAKAFYDDPNVSTYEKAKQFARTGANAALPLAGGIVGSGVTPFLGTAAGTLAGTGLAALIDDEGEALKQYRAKNEPPKGPTAVQNRAAINASEAASRSAPALSDYPTTTTGTASGTPPVPTSTLASSTLSPSSMAKTQAGQSLGSSGTSAGGKGEPDIFSLEGLKAARDKALGNDNYELGALKNQLVQMNDRFKTQAEERLALRKKEIEEEGDVYKDRSDRILARETKLKDQEHQNMGLAFLNAGLAIMSTPGGLATALGKGAQVGTAQYAAGIDKLRAAQERLDDAKERIDELRLNRKDLNKRDIRQLEKERDTALQEGEKLVYGFAKDVYGLKRGDADKVFDKYFSAREKQYEQEQMTKRTMATIASSSDNREKQIWKGLMQKHSNDPVAAAVEWNAMQAGDKTLLAAEKMVQDRAGEYLTANKLQLSMMTPPQRDAAIRKATEQYRKDIYTQFKLTPTMGSGSSGSSGFKLLGVE